MAAHHCVPPAVASSDLLPGYVAKFTKQILRFAKDDKGNAGPSVAQED
jgi:hypothetical protein